MTCGALDFTLLSALHNVAAEQMHSLLVERLFLGCLTSTLGLMAYGTASKVFGLKFETLFRDYKRHRFKRFLLKCLLVVRRQEAAR